MVYKFDEEPCEICSKLSDFCINVGHEKVTEVYRWDNTIENWATEVSYGVPIIFYHFLCSECYDGMSTKIEKGEWPNHDTRED